MHASERTLNIERTLRAFLVGLTLTGTPEFRWANDPRKAPASGWIRATFEFPGGDEAGELSGNKATRAFVLIALDLFWPRQEDTATGSIDGAAVVRDELVAAFRYREIDLYDYSATPASPSLVSGHPIRFHEPPNGPTALEADGPWLRTRVTARGFWHHRHT